jgi:hypothetical protein
VQAQAKEKKGPPGSSQKLTLMDAEMCARIEGNKPQEAAIVFPAGIGNVFCFTSFDPVPANTFIYHNWFFREKLRAKRKLSLKSPRWSTFTKFRIHEKDKGPWRVEILDEKGRTLQIVRFSIVD